MFREIESICFQELSPPPLMSERVPGAGFLSLDLLMHSVPVNLLYDLSATFVRFEVVCRDALNAEGMNVGQRPIPQQQRELWLATFKGILDKPQLRQFVPFCVPIIERVVEGLEKQETTLWTLAELLRDFERRMVDELGMHVFFQVNPAFVELSRYPKRGWEPAISAFPAIESDVLDASYCLVCDRWSASVFHQMRVMEFGLDKLRRMVRVPRKRPGWDGVIEAIDKTLAPQQGKKKSATKRARDRFIAEAVVQLRAIKEIRNTTMHDWTKTYTPNQATDLYRAVRSFMSKMAEASVPTASSPLPSTQAPP
jgi:hypothetical protein